MSLLLYLRRRYSTGARVTRGGRSHLNSAAHYYSSRAPSTSCAMGGPEPVVCRRLCECQEWAQRLLRDVSAISSSGTRGNERREDIGALRCGGAQTLLELQELAERFVATLHSTLFLPRDVVHEVDDFPMFLLRHFQQSRDPKLQEGGPVNEEAIINGFVDWMDLALPTPAASSGREAGFVSFVELMRLVQSFVRYHRGVRWGGGATRAEWHRSGYLLHPWHDTYCPASRAEQMPYVHLLQWMLRRRPTRQGNEPLADANSDSAFNGSDVSEVSRDDAMRWWRATERFSPPSWKTNAGFAALDCGCHSGYMADLLLKAGARRLVGVDVSARALGSAEATLREHLRERRSTASETKTMRLLRCDLLPELELAAQKEDSFAKKEGNIMAAAAARRRCAARQRSFAADVESADASAVRNGDVDSFDFLVFHPPIKPLFPSWPLLEGTMGFVDHSALDAGSDHPHSRLSALHVLLQQLLSSNGGSDDRTPQQRRRVPLLKEDGYVAFILPRAFDSKSILQHTSSASSSRLVGGRAGGDAVPPMSLADVVIAALEGPYKLVLERRHSVAGTRNTGEERPRGHLPFLRAFAHPQFRDRIERELDAFYGMHHAVDLIVLKRKPNTSSANESHEVCGEERRSGNPAENVLPYDESFEYSEYIPAEGPLPRHHWTEMTPSYSYLEDDFFGDNTALTSNTSHERNFLAVGHPMSFNRRRRQQARDGDKWGEASLHAARRNMENYSSLFAAELKRKRGGRVRKMALQPLEKQEWYIDEKLVKSEGAKIDLLNELARFDMKDWS